MKEYKINRLFPSPVFHFRVENHEELNIELESYILDLKKNIRMDKKNQIVEDGILLFLILPKIVQQKNFS